MRQKPQVERSKGERAKKCPATGKRSWKKINGALTEAARLGSATKKLARPYLCEHCGRWHLTSKPGRP